MKYRHDLSKPVSHFYLGSWKDYKVWQEVQPLSNTTSPGHCRYVLVKDNECTYPQTKWSCELTKVFFDQITQVCLKFTQKYSSIHYLGMYEKDHVWEVWNIYDRDIDWSLPHLVRFNGNRYEIVSDRKETMDLVNFFLSTYKKTS